MDLPKILLRYPVAVWSLVLYVCFIVGLGYGSASQSEALSMLNKYRELFFIPILIPFLQQERYRNWAWKIFIVVSVVTLLTSYLMKLGVFGVVKQQEPSFKSHITHSIIIAFFAFFCLHRAIGDFRYGRLFFALFVLSMVDLFFVVQGRTGQFTSIALVLLFTLQRFGSKGRLLSVALIILSLMLFINYSDKAQRINEAIDNTEHYLKREHEQTESSMGQRYSFWDHSLKLIAEKPLFGYGTGSFSKEYQRIGADEHILTKNPHNEFLMIAVQLGLLGLFVYLGFYLSQYHCAKLLPKPDKWLAQGILVSLFITSMFNTPFLDHTEGHWFAIMIALCFAAIPENTATIHVT
jgi:O-antigen ligase